MNLRRLAIRLVTAALLLPGALRAQGGTACCQILQIPASSFVPRNSTVTYEYSNAGYIYVSSMGTQPSNQMWATVTLPSGALIRYLGLFYYDFDSANDITATLRGYTGGNPPLTAAPAFFDVGSVSSSGDPKYAYTDQIVDQTVLNDVASDPAAAQYSVLISVPVATDLLQFKAVTIWWQRQISPAPGAASFGDVPTSDPAFQFVEAFVGTGITAGCGGGNYCPDSPVTRRQMAVFFAKALGLSWPH